MILFFKNSNNYFVVEAINKLNSLDISKLEWLFADAKQINKSELEGIFIGPRKEMITPWSTNAVEITLNMGINGVKRIEQLFAVDSENPLFDPMLEAIYKNPTQDIFKINIEVEPIKYIDDIEKYNQEEGLALSDDEVEYLKSVSKNVNRKLTDSEVYGFAQVNSEHCRHKIFNGSFIIDGETKEDSLFSLIKKTSKQNHNRIISAYKDNVAFIDGPEIEQFAPKTQDKADFFETKSIKSIISLKAETHNFPTTVEPFNGAATGSGGEIRDRLGGGTASIPLTGSAVYMTSYPRLENSRKWEQDKEERKWLYQSPLDILIKASNGASDFGNKYGQPLINGSLLTFEHFENQKKQAYDKVIMLAGGVGYANERDAEKKKPDTGDRIIVMGGDNYRIGMGGSAVSSVATGEYSGAIELNAVQRSNPEMQKRVANAIRAMSEAEINPLKSIHDHGAGGHLNSLSELVEESGGIIDINKLPIGDPTLSAKEIIGNESQERMGMLIGKDDLDYLKRVSERERAPFYDVGETTGDMKFTFDFKDNQKPIDLDLAYLFGKPPKTVLQDITQKNTYQEIKYSQEEIENYINDVLKIEAVASKDWLTNKVDRSVTGRVAKQQCTGEIQLPVNDLGVTALDFKGEKGIASAIGHASVAALANEEAGSRLSVAEALTNLVFAPIEQNLKGVSLSANWMWPAKNPGENARLFNAVKSLSDFCLELGINVPTGKDSLSMTQKYDNEVVYSPGTVIITAAGECSNIKQTLEASLKPKSDSLVFYIDFSKDNFELGGSSFAQTQSKIGEKTPDIKDAEYFKNAFNSVQEIIEKDLALAGHDISAGGMITALLEMCFPNNSVGMNIDLSSIKEEDLVKILFSEKPGILIQSDKAAELAEVLEQNNIEYHTIAKVNLDREFILKKDDNEFNLNIDKLRDQWSLTSYLFDKEQTANNLAEDRFKNYKSQKLSYQFPANFTGKLADLEINSGKSPVAAIIREKGVNGDREMAYSLYKAGFKVKDIHMTDLISGRENLQDINMIVFVGGFSNSDVLGSAKGWAGAFLYNEKAKLALDNFYKRDDTLSLGICNGCQLMAELNLIYPNHNKSPKLKHNDSAKFESGFINVDILDNDSVMLKNLSGSRLGVWVAHGEGKFEMPLAESSYSIPVKYSYGEYPGNPNGSAFNTAGICSEDGRHLAMMPHLERSIFKWQWANYPDNRKADEITPWLQAFVDARKWIEEKLY
jgi:phosphoribosylformylglycinamidine synthase